MANGGVDKFLRQANEAELSFAERAYDQRKGWDTRRLYCFNLPSLESNSAIEHDTVPRLLQPYRKRGEIFSLSAKYTFLGYELSHNSTSMSPWKIPGTLSNERVSKEQLVEQIEVLRTVNTCMEQRLLGQQNTSHLQQQSIRNHEQKILEQEQEIKDQRGKIKSIEEVAARVQEKKEILQTQLRDLSDELRASKAEVETLRSEVVFLKEAVKILKKDTQASVARFDVLNSANNDKKQQLSAQSETVRTLNDDNIKLQKRVAYLEEVVAWTNRETGEDTQGAFDDRATLKKAHDDIASRLGVEREVASELHLKMEAMETENAALKKRIDELQGEASALRDIQPQSLRSLLAVRLVEATYPLPSTDQSAEIDEHLRDWSPKGLSANQLDKICSPAEFKGITNLLPQGPLYNRFYGRLGLDSCCVCSRQKLKLKADAHSNNISLKWLNEFPDQSCYFSCCYEKVCRECFLRHMIDALEYKWWYKLGSLRWFDCPRNGCDNSLGIRCEADLQVCLERNGDVEAEKHVKMYVKALVLRQALETLDPRPNDEALRKAAELYLHLVKANRMYSYFDPRFDSALANNDGCIPEFDPGAIYLANMETSPSSVPLFFKFFRRQNTPKICIVCDGRKFDIDYPNVEGWKVECEAFKGSWMWDILVFPTPEVQHCDLHSDFDVCKRCTTGHIDSLLTNGGPAASENISCPQCNRQLPYDEIRQLSDAETFTKYEKMVLRNTLAKEPNFRWCLGPSCENGQLYEISPRNPKISCEECDFEMCFQHQVPWHEGETCDEYESRKTYGDPEHQKTQEWIKANADCAAMNSAGNASRVRKSTGGWVREGIKKVATFELIMLDRLAFEDQLLRKLLEDLKYERVR